MPTRASATLRVARPAHALLARLAAALVEHLAERARRAALLRQYAAPLAALAHAPAGRAATAGATLAGGPPSPP
jgi:hypothetical protein